MELIEKESIQNILDKTLNGEFDTGIIREKKLGEIYPLIQNLINIKIGNSKRLDESKAFKKIALNILKGVLNEENIKANLGEEYYSKVIIEKKKGVQQLESELIIKPKVLSEEEFILKLAKECIGGIHGNGEERKKNIELIYEKEFSNNLPENIEEKQKKLSEFYEKVRSKVNESLNKDCKEATLYYEKINNFSDKVCDLYETGNIEEIKKIKNDNIHDYPFILFMVKKIIPDFYLEGEENNEFKLIANEIVNGNCFHGQKRKNLLKVFDKDLEEEVKKYINQIYAQEREEKLKKKEK